MVLGCAQIRFLDAKTKVDYLKEAVFLTPIHDDAIPVEWEQCFEAAIDGNELEREPASPSAEFGGLPPVAARARSYAGWNKELVQWIYTHQQLPIHTDANGTLYSHPGESEGEFRVRLQQCWREGRDAMVEKIRQKYGSKIATLQERLRRAQQAVEREREQSQGQTLNAVVSVGAGLFGALFGRKKMATAATSVLREAGRARRGAGDVDRAEETVAALEQQLRELQAQVESEIAGVKDSVDASNAPLQVVAVKPKKTNIQVRLLTLAWVPYGDAGNGELRPAWE
jgi:hypothetical protein